MDKPITDLMTKVEKNGEVCTLSRLWTEFERLNTLENALKCADVICLTAADYSDKESEWTMILAEFEESEFKGNLRDVIDFIESREL